MKIVAFEGLDRSGKSTLRRAFAKATKEKYFTIDRFTTTSRVFNWWFNRETTEWSYFLTRFETFLGADAVVVFIDTTPTVCRLRGAEYTIGELNTQRQFFLNNLRELERKGIIVIYLNTKSVEENVEELICQIESL